jgi:hypothetical protein
MTGTFMAIGITFLEDITDITLTPGTGGGGINPGLREIPFPRSERANSQISPRKKAFIS